MSPCPPVSVSASPQTEDGPDIVSAVGPLMVVSPHYDDAVFSCGHLLAGAAGSTVVTVCTAFPEDDNILTDWDSRCGFSSAGEAMRARREENRDALGILKAEAVDLAFLDDQYRRAPRTSADLLGDTLLATIAEFQPASIFAPLGLFHADHLLVSDVLMTMGHNLPAIRWFAYEEIPYCKQTELVQRRLTELAERGIHAEPYPLHAPASPKAAAVEAYRSQIRGFGRGDGQPILQQPERYWRLHHELKLL